EGRVGGGGGEVLGDAGRGDREAGEQHRGVGAEGGRAEGGGNVDSQVCGRGGGQGPGNRVRIGQQHARGDGRRVNRLGQVHADLHLAAVFRPADGDSVDGRAIERFRLNGPAVDR